MKFRDISQCRQFPVLSACRDGSDGEDRAAHENLGSSHTNSCILVQVCRSNDLAAMLAGKRLAGVAPGVNLSNLLHADDKVCKQGPPDFETQGKTSPEVHNRAISGPTKSLMS